MKVLGICGSHRKESTTMVFLERALDVCQKAGHRIDIVALSGMEIGHCTVCDVCKKEFKCSISDGMNVLYALMDAADAIIIASPVYYGMVSGKLKNMFDRSLPLRRNGMKLGNKVGGAIAVGASRNGGQEMVCEQIKSWMGLHEMITVPDKDTAHFGGIGWVPRGKKPEDDKIGIETCENLGRKIVDVLEITGNSK